MALPADWNGEHLIRGIRPSTNEKKAEGSRIGVAMNKRMREKTGAPCHAAEKYQRWHNWMFPGRGKARAQE